MTFSVTGARAGDFITMKHLSFLSTFLARVFNTTPCACVGPCYPYPGVKVGERKEIIQFLKGVFNVRPPKKSLAPKWNLHLVLQALSTALFEPLSRALPKLVPFKLVFLLGITSVRCVSDLSKLAIGDHYRFSSTGVAFLPMSLAKADDPSHFQQEKVIVSSFQDKNFCPIRALRQYLEAIKDLCGQGQDSLLLLWCLNQSFKPPSAQTVACWLVDTIRMASKSHSPWSVGRDRAHST
jgi:hypothetical protein